MKPVLMFMQRTCPHCRRAFVWMDETKAEHPEYDALEITMIDEREEPELANRYDYYYVPTYYVGEQRVHEGPASKEIVDDVFRKAYEG